MTTMTINQSDLDFIKSIAKAYSKYYTEDGLTIHLLGFLESDGTISYGLGEWHTQVLIARGTGKHYKKPTDLLLQLPSDIELHSTTGDNCVYFRVVVNCSDFYYPREFQFFKEGNTIYFETLEAIL